jgi:hypothetical protein
MFHSPDFARFRPSARVTRVLTAGRREKKQQRVTLHCDMKQRARREKNAALRMEGGINVAG